VLIVAIALGALLAVGVAAVGLVTESGNQQQREDAAAEQLTQRTGPLALPPVPAPKAGTPECAAVLAALPPELIINGARVPRRELAQPAPTGAVAWGDAGHDPVTVRCGVDAPAELTATSPLIDISGVSWLRIAEGGTTSWLAADRPVYVVLTVRENSGSGPVQDLSAILRGTLPKKNVFP
jgi:hypothetical protein